MSGMDEDTEALAAVVDRIIECVECQPPHKRAPFVAIEVSDYVRARMAEADARLHQMAGEIAEIKGSLSQVAVYEGLVGSNTAILVSELVRDHEELEARIDAVMSYLSTAPTDEEYLRAGGEEATEEVARLLRGGKRTPDDASELDGTDG